MNEWSGDGFPLLVTACGLLAAIATTLGWLWQRERRRFKERASEDSELIASITSSPISFCIIDREGRFVHFNHPVLSYIGVPREQIIGRHLTELLPEGARDNGNELLRRTLTGEKVSDEIKLLHPEGYTIDLHIDCAPLYKNGSPISIVVFTQDLSERKRSIERIRYMAYYDDMTGLPNRRSFMSRLEYKLSEAKNSGQVVAVWYLDVDRFKLVNASYGRDFGDMLLLQIAERLTRCTDQQDLARVEGDEFVGMLHGEVDSEQATAYLESVLRVFEAPFELSGVTLYVTVSVGLAYTAPGVTDAGGLLKKADTALHRAKENGRNNFLVYHSDYDNTALAKLTLHHELIEALRLQQLTLYYQPQYDLKTGQIIGLEALIRWNHPVKGLIPPASFIPAAEDSGLIVALGEWVLRDACRQHQEWQASGKPAIPISVNLSVRQFAQPNLIGLISGILEETGMDPRYLKVEITESMTMDVGRATDLLMALTEIGIGISIDDFGTGYSSFHYLKSLPIGTLKIDRSFVRDIQQDPNDRAIVAAIIAMAHNLQLNVIAEGVETEEQVRFLQQQCCDEMQGYYASPPLPAHQVEALLDVRLTAITDLSLPLIQ